MINFSDNRIGLQEQHVIDLLNYILDTNIDTQLIESSTIQIDSLRQLYAYMIQIRFNKMCAARQLIMGYTARKTEELNYIVGVPDVYTTIVKGSKTRGMISQSVRYRSYNTEINKVIKYCLQYSLQIIATTPSGNTNNSTKTSNSTKTKEKEEEDKRKAIITETSLNYQKVFKDSLPKTKEDFTLPQYMHQFDDSDTATNIKISHLKTLYKYYTGVYRQEYKNYREILNFCKLLLEKSWYNIDDTNKQNQEIQDNIAWSLMERYTRTACERILKKNKYTKYKHLGIQKFINDNIKIYKNEKFGDLEVDILIEMMNSAVIIDVKTNEHLCNQTSDGKYGKYSYDKNTMQIYSYSQKYKSMHNSQCSGALFHYIAQVNSGEAEEFRDKPIWDAADNLTIFVYVIQDTNTYKTNNTTIADDAAIYIEQCLDKLLGITPPEINRNK